MLSLSVADLVSHVVKIGLDVFPPVEIASERTRLSLFADELCAQFPALYEQVLLSDTRFEISKQFRIGYGPAAMSVTTFALTQRGPVFVFPLLLPPPVGSTGIESSYLDDLPVIRSLFLSKVVGRDCLRLGLIRDLIFQTGVTPCLAVISDKDQFAGGHLVGGQLLLVYRDERCNVRVKLDTVELSTTTQLAIGTTVEQHRGHGLAVEFDVNNVDVRALPEAEMGEIIERASSLWPDALITYVNGLGEHSP